MGLSIRDRLILWLLTKLANGKELPEEKQEELNEYGDDN